MSAGFQDNNTVPVWRKKSKRKSSLWANVMIEDTEQISSTLVMPFLCGPVCARDFVRPEVSSMRTKFQCHFESNLSWLSELVLNGLIGQVWPSLRLLSQMLNQAQDECCSCHWLMCNWPNSLDKQQAMVCGSGDEIQVCFIMQASTESSSRQGRCIPKSQRPKGKLQEKGGQGRHTSRKILKGKSGVSNTCREAPWNQ